MHARTLTGVLPAALLALLLAGCASPAPHPAKQASAFPVGTAQAHKTPGFLLGGRGEDLGTDVLCRQGGGCSLFGQTMNSFSSSSDMLAASAAPAGTIQWSRRYGGKHAEKVTAVAAGASGGALLAGTTQSDLLNQAPDKEEPMPARPLLVHIGSDGKPTWGALISSGLGKVLDATRTADGYVLVGYAVHHQDKHHQKNIDAAVVKLNKDGQLMWSYRYDLGATDTANGVAVGKNGQILVVGASVSHSGKPRAFVLSLDSQGHVRHAVTYAGRRSLYFARFTGSGYLVGGQTRPARGPLLAARVNATGQPQWAYDYRAAVPVTPLDMVANAQGGFLITGRTRIRYQREGGVAALFDAKGKPVTDLQVGGKGVVEFLSAAIRAPDHYLLWGDTTLFGAHHIDMMGVEWSPAKGMGSDFKRKAVRLHPHGIDPQRASLAIGYQRLQGGQIPSSPIRLHP